jgi:hypothetical protein
MNDSSPSYGLNHALPIFIILSVRKGFEGSAYLRRAYVEPYLIAFKLYAYDPAAFNYKLLNMSVSWFRRLRPALNLSNIWLSRE